jgi:DNA-binding IscR family transcriptional regulator
MLKKALGLIARGQVCSLDELSAEMGLPQPLAEQLVGRLVENGYLRETGEGATTASDCVSCSLRSQCESIARPRMWELTPKGLAAAVGPRTAH